MCPVGSFTYRIHLNASPQCYGMAVHETVRIASGNTDRIASGNTGKLLKSNSLVRSCMRSSLRYWPMAALVWPEDTQRQVLAPWGLSDSAFSSTSGLVKRQYKAIRMLRRGNWRNHHGCGRPHGTAQLMDYRIDDGRLDGADITSSGCRRASEPDHPQQHLAQLTRTSQLSLEASAFIRTSTRTHRTRSRS